MIFFRVAITYVNLRLVLTLGLSLSTCCNAILLFFYLYDFKSKRERVQGMANLGINAELIHDCDSLEDSDPAAALNLSLAEERQLAFT